jgi:hypothetical protein
MRIDHTQRAWALASLTILASSSLVYAGYAINSPQGPHGGSTIGLLFGIIGFAYMIFAGLLGARNRVSTWRLGSARAWMRGHLWLGLLSLPFILFHGGFHFGGALTTVLMWLLIITVASGVFGAALQNYVPRLMTTELPLETIYAEIANVRALLREEADRSVEALCGSLGLSKSAHNPGQRAGGFTALRPMPAPANVAEVTAATETLVLTEAESACLREFYLGEMRPFLENPKQRGSLLADEDKTLGVFTGLSRLLPQNAQSTLQDLRDICDEARQLVRQERLHHWLHGWLLVHIPLSLALLLLGAIHAIVALRYF